MGLNDSEGCGAVEDDWVTLRFEERDGVVYQTQRVQRLDWPSRNALDYPF